MPRRLVVLVCCVAAISLTLAGGAHKPRLARLDTNVPLPADFIDPESHHDLGPFLRDPSAGSGARRRRPGSVAAHSPELGQRRPRHRRPSVGQPGCHAPARDRRRRGPHARSPMARSPVRCRRADLGTVHRRRAGAQPGRGGVAARRRHRRCRQPEDLRRRAGRPRHRDARRLVQSRLGLRRRSERPRCHRGLRHARQQRGHLGDGRRHRPRLLGLLGEHERHGGPAGQRHPHRQRNVQRGRVRLRPRGQARPSGPVRNADGVQRPGHRAGGSFSRRLHHLVARGCAERGQQRLLRLGREPFLLRGKRHLR